MNLKELLNKPITTNNFGISYNFEKESNNSQKMKRLKKSLIPKKALGVTFSAYGGFNDGGYVLANDIKNTDGLVSLGVENNINFEKSLELMISFIHTYDFSVDDVPEKILNNTFFKEKIGFESDGDTNLSKIISRIKSSDDLILKVDIELGEYPLLLEASSEELNKFRQIVIEFHELLAIDDDEIFESIVSAIEKISLTHQSVWVHGNNGSPVAVIGNHSIPSVLEVLFLRKSSYEFTDYVNEYADIFYNLRGPNHGGAEDIRLNFTDI